MRRLLSVFIIPVLLLSGLNSIAQAPFNLIDGREHKYCSSCQCLIREMPPEVLFGLHIHADGDIYFSMNNTVWFNKIFKSNSYGVSVDLVSKDRYSCSKKNTENNVGVPKGTMLQPVYKTEMVKMSDELMEGAVYVKIGKVPKNLINKELEANLVIVNGNYICYYSNFVNIDRTAWHLLPMGLFTDSLIQYNSAGNVDTADFFTFSKKIKVEIPFEKASANFNSNYLKKFYDSLELSKYSIRKIEVRAYSSVEGSEKLNNELMSRRADTIIQALKKYQPGLQRISALTAENWLEFFQDIEDSKFSKLHDLSKLQIKQKLTDKALLNQIEPVLSKHRKAVITMYLEYKTAGATEADSTIISAFKKAVIARDFSKASAVQKEIVERILDNRLPLAYMSRLEVPQTKEFSSLLNDREVYKYLLKATSEYDALDNFKQLKHLDPGNGRINYNICALQFFMWQYGGDTLIKKSLLKDISALPKLGIDTILVKRMTINYHILKCEEDMRVYNYDAKDSSLDIIHSMFEELNLNDQDLYSLAKYYAYYARYDWAQECIEPRVSKIDASEDLIFYYINLLFFSPSDFDSEEFEKAILNAIALNNKRFCNFFLPNDKGGAGMQLLEYDELKAKYCESCK